jgi:hypothetical protein
VVAGLLLGQFDGEALIVLGHVTTTIQYLRLEKEKIERTIEALEQLLKTDAGDEGVQPKHRGRKSMGLEERQVVSDRMKRYWLNRRSQS